MCKRQIGPGIPTRRVVVETRPKVYPIRPKANFGFRNAFVTRKLHSGKKVVVRVRERSRKPGDKIADSGGEGFETVREMTVCPACASKSGER